MMLQPSVLGREPPITVITGATGGIGRWIALGMARAGHHVTLIDRDRARGRRPRPGSIGMCLGQVLNS
jgi:NAD(P)-dependent dehydrogenase (short-subunit alcohol dehydrogenase family)